MKIRIKFAKQGTMKFIGHLDVMRYFQKAMRRADVDIRYSEGFSPHQIMSFASPLGVGLTSVGEYMDIEVHSTDSSAEMERRLNEAMVEGFQVLSWRRLPDEDLKWWTPRTIRSGFGRAADRRTPPAFSPVWRHFPHRIPSPS